jgi:hypothetical protein
MDEVTAWLLTFLIVLSTGTRRCAFGRIWGPDIESIVGFAEQENPSCREGFRHCVWPAPPQPDAAAHADRQVRDSNKSDVEPEMIDDPRRFEPANVSRNRAEPALLIKIGATLVALNRRDEINQLRDDGLTPNIEHWLVRCEQIVPLDLLKFKSTT